MQALYNFLVGPGAVITFLVFLGGAAYRLLTMYALSRSKDVTSLAYMDAYYALRSLAHWALPFGSAGWRENPGVTVASFVFHLCLVGLLLFASGHVILLEYNFGFTLPMLPGGLAEGLTVLAILACGYFAYRRMFVANVRFVTWTMDWVMLVLAALPFITGLLASRHLMDPLLIGVLHVASGELAIMAIPFTRLAHAMFLPINRAYLGSEFGKVRHAIDW